MKLYEFTAIPNPDDPAKIAEVQFVVANHDDPDERTEWITVQVSVDVPTVRNGALLRAEALQKARDILDQLRADFQHLGDQAQQGYQRHPP